MMRFSNERREKEEEVRKKLPLEYFSKEKKEFNEIRREKALKDTIVSGDTFPLTEIVDIDGFSRNFDELFEDHDSLIISYQRGEWCPFCNLELKHLQKRMKDYHRYSANVISIVPRSRKKMQPVIDKYNLDFEIMHDRNMSLAQELGIVFELPDFMVSVYENLGMDKEYINEKGRYQVPVPATFIVTRDKVIRKHFIDLDYMRRLDPDRILDYFETNNERKQKNIPEVGLIGHRSIS